MAVSPVAMDLRAWRNADYIEEFTLAEDFSAGIPINPIDLTGWSAELQVRLYGLASGDPLIDLQTVTTEVEGIRFMEPAQGVIRVWIDWDTLEALPDGGKKGFDRTFSYDLILIDPAGIRSVYATGSLIVPPGVTRP